MPSVAILTSEIATLKATIRERDATIRELRDRVEHDERRFSSLASSHERAMARFEKDLERDLGLRFERQREADRDVVVKNLQLLQSLHIQSRFDLEMALRRHKELMVSTNKQDTDFSELEFIPDLHQRFMAKVPSMLKEEAAREKTVIYLNSGAPRSNSTILRKGNKRSLVARAGTLDAQQLKADVLETAQTRVMDALTHSGLVSAHPCLNE